MDGYASSKHLLAFPFNVRRDPGNFCCCYCGDKVKAIIWRSGAGVDFSQCCIHTGPLDGDERSVWCLILETFLEMLYILVRDTKSITVAGCFWHALLVRQLLCSRVKFYLYHFKPEKLMLSDSQPSCPYQQRTEQLLISNTQSKKQKVPLKRQRETRNWHFN